MEIIIIVFLFYGVSVLGAYKFVQKSHSKGGRWDLLYPNCADVTIIFLPILNSFLAIDYLFKGYLPKNSKTHLAIKFFRINK